METTFIMKNKTQTLENLEREVSFIKNRGHEMENFHIEQGTEYI